MEDFLVVVLKALLKFYGEMHLRCIITPELSFYYIFRLIIDNIRNEFNYKNAVCRVELLIEIKIQFS